MNNSCEQCLWTLIYNFFKAQFQLQLQLKLKLSLVLLSKSPTTHPLTEKVFSAVLVTVNWALYDLTQLNLNLNTNPNTNPNLNLNLN